MDLLGDTFEDGDNADSEEDEDQDIIGYYSPERNIRFWVSERYVNARSGHVCVTYRGQAIVWGGSNRNPYRFLPAEEVLIFCPESCTWSCVITGGDLPPGRSGAVAAVVGDFMYLACGFDEDVANRSNHMWSLDLRKMVWTRVLAAGDSPLKCDKGAGWSYGGQLYLFGGFGLRPLPGEMIDHHDFDFTEIDDPTSEGSGWSNQLVRYDPSSNKWSWPKTHGKPPLPRAGHAIATIGNKVYIFGGRHGHLRLSDLHCLDINSMAWVPVLPDCRSGQGPSGRSWHSFVSLAGAGLLLYGGFSNESSPLMDCWLLDMANTPVTWRRSTLALCERRWWHTMVVLDYTIIVIGGLYTDTYHPKESIIVNTSPQALLSICYRAITQEMDFHMRSNSLLDLPGHLLSVILSQKIQISVQNYQDLRKLALGSQKMDISKCLLNRISNFCNKYKLKYN